MSFDWPPGWRDVVGTERERLTAQILRELAPAHLLSGRDFTLIARRDDQDDVLIQLDDTRVAEMHLTWAKKGDAKFPGAIVHQTLGIWRMAQF